MTAIQEHVPFEVLNDYVDGKLNWEHAARVERHIAGCETCRSEHDLLRLVLRSATSAASSIVPEHDLWPDLRRQLESRKEAAFPTSINAPSSRVARGREHGASWRNRAWLAVAAVVLVVVSSGVTALVLRHDAIGRVERLVRGSRAPEYPVARAAVLPASFRSAESEYVRTIEELRNALNAQRSQLDPATVATVERSLTVIDSAIVEARAALLADPNNRVLVDILAASYQRKLDLLRRATELSSRI